MRLIFVVIVALFFLPIGLAAQGVNRKHDQFLNLTVGFGSSQGLVAASYNYNWRFGKKSRLEAGLGLRFTSYIGRNKYYRTAPAKLTSGKTGLGVLFSDDINENIDTVFFNKPQVNFLNAAINLGYNFNSKFSAGFNIDFIGFSFGAEKIGTYYDGNNVNPPTAKPTAFNLLLTSDNDKGSLNSELFAKYKFNQHWAVNVAFGFLFTEYTTTTNIQTTPNGQTNDRFRNKATTGNVGISYNF